MVAAKVGLALLAFGGCVRSDQGTEVSVSTRPSETKIVCVGRFLLDLPVGFEQTLGSDAELIFGPGKDFRRIKVEIAREAVSKLPFNGIVKKRLDELGALENPPAPTKSILAAFNQPHPQTAVVRAYTSMGRMNSFKVQVLREVGPVVASFKDDAFRDDDPAQIEAKLLATASRTQTFQGAAPAAGRGACLGPLLIDAGQDGESLTLAFKSATMQDVSISIDIQSLMAKTDGGLFKRIEQKSGLLAQAGIGPGGYRKRTVMLGDRSAEEVFRAGKEQGRTTRQFVAETVMSQPATLDRPLMAITLSMGGQVGPDDYRDASMTEPDAMAMWDAILKSVRLRPGAI